MLGIAAAALIAAALLAFKSSGPPPVAEPPSSEGPTTAGSPSPERPPKPPPTGAVSVVSYGAKGDGRTDDSAAVLAAAHAAAKAGRAVSVPRGTYVVGTFTLPADVTLVGAGMGQTHIKGRVAASSGDKLRDLTVGIDGGSFRFVNGARDVLFERVAFVGGGGSGDDLVDRGVVRFHDGRRASFITFRECTFGRNSADDNGVSVIDRGRPDATYHNILFDRCLFLSSPRMSLEVIQRPDAGQPVTTGYRNIDLIGNVFEPAGSEAISFDAKGGSAGHSTLSGNLIKGAGTNLAYPWGQGVEFNGAVEMVFTKNTVYRCRGPLINHQGDGRTPSNNVFSGNTFDTTVSHIDQLPSEFAGTIEYLNVVGARFVNNTVRTNVGGQQIVLSGSSRNHFSGNRVSDARPAPQARASVWLVEDSSNNAFRGDYFDAAADRAVFCASSGSNNNTVTKCTFVTHGVPPVWAAPGLKLKLVQNTYR